MKKFLIALGVIVVLLIAALLIIPSLIPVETYKEQIAEQVREMTGREFAINGEVSVSLLPNVALEVHDVVFGNVAGARTKNMVSLKTLEIDVKLFPLISGELVVNRFILIDPVINLEILPDGTPNWQIAGMAGADDGDDSGDGGGPGLDSIQLGDVRLENGRVTYFDGVSGTEHVISDVNVNLDLKSIDAPFSMVGSLVWQDEKIDLSVSAEKFGAVLQGGSTAGEVKVSSAPVNFDFKGMVTGGDAANVAGDIGLQVPSVRNLMRWLGNPMPEGDGIQLLDIKGKLAASAGKVSFSEAVIAFDDIKGKGELSADMTGAVPSVAGRLDLEMLDVERYLPKDSGAGDDGGAASEGWSDDPIDVSALKLANADFTLTAEGIKTRRFTIGRSALTIKLDGGKLVVDLTELALYGGTGKGRVVLDGSGDVLSIQEEMTLTGVQAEPLLTDTMGSDRLSGNGNTNFKLTTSGASQRQLVKNLNGSGAFNFLDGAIKGINLAAMVRDAATAFLGGEQENQKTDFSELSASFTITNGILSNNDFKMSSPLFRVTGEGTVDLPARTVDYTVFPKLVASTTGQGGDEDLAGITIPIIVSGPWSDLSFKPDLAAAIGDPAKLVEGAAGAVGSAVEGGADALGSVVEGGTGAIGGLLGGGDAATDAATGGSSGSVVDEPTKLIKGLFGD